MFYLDKKCYIMFPERYDDNTGLKIYIIDKPQCLFEKKYSNGTKTYNLRCAKAEFNIIFNENDNINKVHKRKAFVYDNNNYENVVGETTVIFSFDKDGVIEYYKNKLNEISETLEIKKQQLAESIIAVEKQKEILNKNSDNLFEIYISF